MRIPVLCKIDDFFTKRRHEKKEYKRAQEEFKNYKYVHILPAGGIHTKTIIDFLNKYFSHEEHAFVLRWYNEKIKDIYIYDNVFVITDLTKVPLEICDKIIFHSLLDQNMVNFLYQNKKYLSKSYWFIWGGDLYSAPENKQNYYVKTHIAGILTSFDQDEYVQKYGDKKCYDVTYPHGTIDVKKVKRKNKTVNILVNNCADFTSIEMLKTLSKFKDEDIAVYTVLSYIAANQKDFRLSIMYNGYELLGNKFHPILKYMTNEEYSKFLSDIDIYISNQNRAQGNGNASYVLVNGGKVFTKKTGVYKKYNSVGIKYFDTDKIKKMSFDEFIGYNEKDKINSIKVLKHRMLDSTKVRQWGDFFND